MPISSVTSLYELLNATGLRAPTGNEAFRLLHSSSDAVTCVECGPLTVQRHYNDDNVLTTPTGKSYGWIEIPRGMADIVVLPENALVIVGNSLYVDRLLPSFAIKYQAVHILVDLDSVTLHTPSTFVLKQYIVRNSLRKSIQTSTLTCTGGVIREGQFVSPNPPFFPDGMYAFIGTFNLRLWDVLRPDLDTTVTVGDKSSKAAGTVPLYKLPFSEIRLTAPTGRVGHFRAITLPSAIKEKVRSHPELVLDDVIQGY